MPHQPDRVVDNSHLSERDLFLTPNALEKLRGHPFLLRLGSVESAFGASSRALAAMKDAVEDLSGASDPQCIELRTILAAQCGVSIENIAIGAGIEDLLGLIIGILLNRGVIVVSSHGGYPMFDYQVVGVGGCVEHVPYHDNCIDLEALAAEAKRAGARVVFLANPDNPTGSWHKVSDLSAFLDTLPQGCLLLLDEAYSDYAPLNALPTLDVIDPRVIRIRTFSKAHGLAGARVGYAIAPVEIVRSLDRIRPNPRVDLAVQRGALASLADVGHLQSVIAAVSVWREEYAKLGKEIGLL